MSKNITRKSDLLPIAKKLVNCYENATEKAFWRTLEEEVLEHKVRFPLLEDLAIVLYRIIPEGELLKVTDKLVKMNYEGAYVIVGTLLAQLMKKDLPTAYRKA